MLYSRRVEQVQSLALILSYHGSSEHYGMRYFSLFISRVCHKSLSYEPSDYPRQSVQVVARPHVELIGSCNSCPFLATCKNAVDAKSVNIRSRMPVHVTRPLALWLLGSAMNPARMGARAEAFCVNGDAGAVKKSMTSSLV